MALALLTRVPSVGGDPPRFDISSSLVEEKFEFKLKAAAAKVVHNMDKLN